VYVGTVSHHLYDSRDINAAVYGPGATEDNAQSMRPILPQYYGSMPGLFSDTDANYHALQMSVQKRFASKYSVQGSYTWSKSIDNRSRSLLGSGAQDPNNWGRAERGLPDFNVGQIFAINGLWDLPDLKGRGFVTAVAGGRRLSGIFRYNGGTPQSVYSGQDNALIGYSRPNGGMERADVIDKPNLDFARSRRAFGSPILQHRIICPASPRQVRHRRTQHHRWPGTPSERYLCYEGIPLARRVRCVSIPC
jgi:hypothetical protein